MIFYIKLVHTSRQNGAAEKKVWHLLDVTHTLLIHMHVPKVFWADAILHACHLINRMSPFVPHDKIPFHCLFSDKPTFSVVPRVFGSTCFIQNLKPRLDKLEPRAIKCVFISYSRKKRLSLF